MYILIGKGPEKLSRSLEAGIHQVLILKEGILIQAAKQYNLRNFFEMVRYDFVIDADLNVFLMEVNMSPNLSSTHFPLNKLLYEQVIYSMLSLVGFATAVRLHTERYHAVTYC